MSDTIRVLRILEYTGPREAVERQIKRSIHGERVIRDGSRPGDTITIRAATIGEFPEVLMRDEPVVPIVAKPIPVHSEFAPSPIASIPPFPELICASAGCAHPYATHSQEGCMVWNGDKCCRCEQSFGVYDNEVAKNFSVDDASSWNSAPTSTPDDEVPF